MTVSVYIAIEIYKGERSPLTRIDPLAYWNKALADDYVATQNAHLKELNIERVYYKRSPNPGFPFSELITTERSM